MQLHVAHVLEGLQAGPGGDGSVRAVERAPIQPAGGQTASSMAERRRVRQEGRQETVVKTSPDARLRTGVHVLRPPTGRDGVRNQVI